MQMATVMMSTTMKPASLMEEIAVDLMLIQIIVMNACALKKKLAIRAGSLMGIVMMSIIMKPAFLMEEIAVDLMSIPIIAQNVYALMVEGSTSR